MLKRDIADRLYSLVYNRFKEEQPGRVLTENEMDNIWFSIYGKLSSGDPEKDVEKWCKTVQLSR